MNNTNVLDLSGDGNGAMLEQVIDDNRAWTRDTVEPDDWTVKLPDAALEEIEAMLQVLRRDPLPTLLLRADQFELPACGDAIGKLKQIVSEGLGVAVLDSLPMDTMSIEEARSVYWVLGQFLGREVAQKWDGSLLYDVKDTGAPFGYGVRASWTDAELYFHTDNCFAVAPPDYVGLLCVNPAKSGGISRFCSLYSIHNEMLKHQPQLLARLYEPCYYYRQAEHAPDDPKVARTRPFQYDGKRLWARFSSTLVRRGHELIGEELDQQAQEAFAAVEEIMADPKQWMEFTIQRGQIQVLNNWEFAHYRSSFEDSEDPGLKRHLMRLWFRDKGRISYNG